MSNYLSLIIFGAFSFGALYVFLTMPAWCFQSVHRHAIWKVRDSIVDDVIEGALPEDHPVVQEVVWRANWAVSHRRPRHITDLWSWAIARRSQTEALGRPTESPLDGDLSDAPALTEDQRTRVIAYRDSLDLLMVSSLLLGSWWGFLYILRYAIPELFGRVVRSVFVGRARSDSPQLGGVASEAMYVGAQRAIHGPRLGRFIPQHAGQLYIPD